MRLFGITMTLLHLLLSSANSALALEIKQKQEQIGGSIQKQEQKIDINNEENKNNIVEVLIEGISDSKHEGIQKDYKEAVLDAKLKAIERAGVNISTISTVKNSILVEDWIESKGKGILLPGFRIIKIGYGKDGFYRVVLQGKVKSFVQAK